MRKIKILEEGVLDSTQQGEIKGGAIFDCPDYSVTSKCTNWIGKTECIIKYQSCNPYDECVGDWAYGLCQKWNTKDGPIPNKPSKLF